MTSSCDAVRRYSRRRFACGALTVDVVGVGAPARPFLVQVLAPEQELDRMEAGGDVLLAPFFVQRRDQGGVDRRIRVRLIDDARVGLAVNVVDEVLVDRPGVDQAFDRLDRTVVEAEGFGLHVRDAGDVPRRSRPLQRLVVRRFGECVDGGRERARSSQRIDIAGVSDRSVLRDDLVLECRQRA